jgi:hypothetical protein
MQFLGSGGQRSSDDYADQPSSEPTHSGMAESPERPTISTPPADDDEIPF